MKDRLEIELHDVGVRRAGHWVLKGVTLRLRHGERWALLGGNGSGKTQLLKILASDVWPTPTGREELTYRLGGRRIDVPDAKEHIAYVGAERQDRYVRYGWDPTVRDLVATGLHRTDLLLQPVTPPQRRRVAELLRACGLEALGGVGFSSLSYGQKRLVLLARALVTRPDWLLLDELYNGLDTAHRRAIDRVLGAARRQGQAWVVAAHRAADVPRGTMRLLRIEGGRIESIGRLRRDALPGRLDGADRRRRFVLRPAARPRRSTAQPLLRLEHADLYVAYGLVLRDVNWELRAGEQWAVLGANGSGKSSFLKLLYGDLSPAWGGRIERRGCPAGTPIEVWKRRVGFVSPELQADYWLNVSVRELVASGRHSSIGLSQPLSGQDRRSAARWLKFFGLQALADRRPREISYGQLRRALIARALSANPRILLLDEPLTGLDPGQRTAVKRLLARLIEHGITLVMAVHHPEDLPRGITHALRLRKQRASALHCDGARLTDSRRSPE